MSETSKAPERRASAEERQRRWIAEATCRLVAEHGLDAVTMRRVASELGSTTGLVTHYFPQKEALLQAALCAALSNLAESYPADHQQPGSLDEWVEQFLVSFPPDEVRRTFWRVLAAFQSASMTTPRLAEVARRYGDRTKPELAQLIAATVPEESAERVAELTEVLWLIVDGIGVTVALHGEHLNIDLIRDTLYGAWRGLLSINPPHQGENT